MKVKNLVAKLNNCDPEAEVVLVLDFDMDSNGDRFYCAGYVNKVNLQMHHAEDQIFREAAKDATENVFRAVIIE